MYDEIKQLDEIDDLSIIDFNNDDWSWGFGYDQSEGLIYHTTEKAGNPCDSCTIAYVVPQFMSRMITSVRDGAVHNLKTELRSLDIKRSQLLKI